MYRVLLVDDEPLVLAGIKSMIEWEKFDCQLIGNARNGKQALEIIEKLHPDIIIADINMPVMDGVELLKTANRQYPEITFVMLSNLQEFQLARDSLRYHAVDYLIKTMLEPEVLQESLERAKAEVDIRRQMNDSSVKDGYQKVNEGQTLSGAVRHFMSISDIPKEVEAAFLEKRHFRWICYDFHSVSLSRKSYLA
ncbi:response regulator [Konateibacter massiliensis]|uniref:response regulator n=1 Tax=Konateibacter massiliensis TaxID=2002841 RepID=UPI000C161754|nr:response regulator [Konateibacter massiliensis]